MTNNDEPDIARVAGDNIRRIRKAKGLSQDDLANKCDMSKRAICRAENAASSKNGMGIQMLVKIANGVGVTPNDLLEGTFSCGVDAKQMEIQRLLGQMTEEQQDIILRTCRQFANMKP